MVLLDTDVAVTALDDLNDLKQFAAKEDAPGIFTCTETPSLANAGLVIIPAEGIRTPPVGERSLYTEILEDRMKTLYQTAQARLEELYAQREGAQSPPNSLEWSQLWDTELFRGTLFHGMLAEVPSDFLFIWAMFGRMIGALGFTA